jgi:hypothetical protein
MNKVMVLRVVNAALFLSFILQVVTSLIIFLRINISFKHLIFEVHEYNGLCMIALVVVHIALNFGWIRANFFKKR